MSETTAHYDRVKEFMVKAGQETPEKITIPESHICLLRAKLILEEACETIRALGFRFAQTPKLYPTQDFPVDLEELIDGCTDISVVTIGTLISFGLPDIPFLEETDNANLRKFTGDSHRREDGKWIKPTDWTPPNHLQHLEASK